MPSSGADISPRRVSGQAVALGRSGPVVGMDQTEHESEVRGLPLDVVVDDTSDRTAGVIAASAGLVLLIIVGVIAFVAGSDAPWWLYVALGAVAAAIFAVTYRLTRTWAGWGNPALYLPSSEPLHLGDHVTVRFRRVARAGTNLADLSISAKIVAEETVGADGRNSQQATVYEAPGEVVLFSVINQTVEADIALEVPLSAAPPTTSMGFYEVRWWLIVGIEAPNAPDDDSEFVLVVDPVVAVRLQSGGSGR